MMLDDVRSVFTGSHHEEHSSSNSINRFIITGGGEEDIQATIEEPWSEQAESTLSLWRVECVSAAKSHAEAGYRQKSKNQLVSFILTLLASLSFVLNIYIDSCSASLRQKVLVGIVSALNLFFASISSMRDYGGQSKEHFKAEEERSKVAIDIDAILTRHRSFRPPSDEVMAGFRERMKSLLKLPEIPKSKYYFF